MLVAIPGEGQRGPGGGRQGPVVEAAAVVCLLDGVRGEYLQHVGRLNLVFSTVELFKIT